MARRVLDLVSLSELKKHNDEGLTELVSDKFGKGTLVKEAKTQQVQFSKSQSIISTTGISKMVRKISREFKHDSDVSYLVDSAGIRHTISNEALDILKALSFYSITCNDKVSVCIIDLFKEIDLYFLTGAVKELVSVVIETTDNGVVEYSHKHLMEACRLEVFTLLREAGVSIG